MRARFDKIPKIRNNLNCKLETCTSCIYCKGNYLETCSFFKFGKKCKFKWTYRRNFTCNSLNVIYIVKCNYCDGFYIGETTNFKKRIRKHKSDTLHPENSNCRKLSYHLHNCSKLRIPFFNIYPIMYIDDANRRKFIEKRFILQYNPDLNLDH